MGPAALTRAAITPRRPVPTRPRLAARRQIPTPITEMPLHHRPARRQPYPALASNPYAPTSSAAGLSGDQYSVQHVDTRHCDSRRRARTCKGNSCPLPGGSTTPNYGSGAATPAYGSGASTPNYGSGATTPSYGSGASTPNYGSGATTPSYGSGAATPAYGSGATTPNYGSARRPPAMAQALTHRVTVPVRRLRLTARVLPLPVMAPARRHPAMDQALPHRATINPHLPEAARAQCRLSVRPVQTTVQSGRLRRWEAMTVMATSMVRPLRDRPPRPRRPTRLPTRMARPAAVLPAVCPQPAIRTRRERVHIRRARIPIHQARVQHIAPPHPPLHRTARVPIRRPARLRPAPIPASRPIGLAA